MALWIGSRVQNSSSAPKTGPVFVVIVSLAIFSLLLAALLARLSASYDQFTGHTASVHRHVSWLRSMRGERREYEGDRPSLTASERILVLMVVIAFAIFEVWFFFFSASPIDQRSGRSGLPPPATASTAL
jgi:small neutral amino acid transporter SnatA (MarC family)